MATGTTDAINEKQVLKRAKLVLLRSLLIKSESDKIDCTNEPSTVARFLNCFFNCTNEPSDVARFFDFFVFGESFGKSFFAPLQGTSIQTRTPLGCGGSTGNLFLRAMLLATHRDCSGISVLLRLRAMHQDCSGTETLALMLSSASSL